MATRFRIKYVTRTSNESYQVLIIVKSIALDPDKTERLFEQFKLRQQKLEKKTKVLQRKTVPEISLVCIVG